MSEFFDFLYDDEALNPIEKLGRAVSGTADSVKETISDAANSTAGRWVKNAATVGLVVGTAVGSAALMIGISNGIVDSLFGKK